MHRLWVKVFAGRLLANSYQQTAATGAVTMSPGKQLVSQVLHGFQK